MKCSLEERCEVETSLEDFLRRTWGFRNVGQVHAGERWAVVRDKAGEVLAAGCVFVNELGTAWIDRTIVDPGHRGQGYQSVVVRCLTAYAISQGALAVESSVEPRVPASLATFIRHGFSIQNLAEVKSGKQSYYHLRKVIIDWKALPDE